VVGVLPMNVPSSSMSAPAGSEVMVTVAGGGGGGAAAVEAGPGVVTSCAGWTVVAPAGAMVAALG